VTLKATGKEVSPGVYTFQGTQPIKMSDFGMKAPTAMMGTLKVKDDVTVNYRVTFEGAVVKFQCKRIYPKQLISTIHPLKEVALTKLYYTLRGGGFLN